jgi:hypothetical protein
VGVAWMPVLMGMEVSGRYWLEEVIFASRGCGMGLGRG